MTKPQQKKQKPVFHEAVESFKSEFQPHHVGAIEENDGIGQELSIDEHAAEDVPFVDEISRAQEPLIEEIVQKTSMEDSAIVSPPEPEAPSTSDVLSNGWKLISAEQQTGSQYWVTHDLNDEGIIAYWRRTRVLSHFKWTTHGKWSVALTRQDVLPEPRYYKEIY